MKLLSGYSQPSLTLRHTRKRVYVKATEVVFEQSIIELTIPSIKEGLRRLKDQLTQAIASLLVPRFSYA